MFIHIIIKSTFSVIYGSLTTIVQSSPRYDINHKGVEISPLYCLLHNVHPSAQWYIIRGSPVSEKYLGTQPTPKITAFFAVANPSLHVTSVLQPVASKIQ